MYGEVAETGDGAATQLLVVGLQAGKHGLNAAGLADRHLVRIYRREKQKRENVRPREKGIEKEKQKRSNKQL